MQQLSGLRPHGLGSGLSAQSRAPIPVRTACPLATAARRASPSPLVGGNMLRAVVIAGETVVLSVDAMQAQRRWWRALTPGHSGPPGLATQHTSGCLPVRGRCCAAAPPGRHVRAAADAACLHPHGRDWQPKHSTCDRDRPSPPQPCLCPHRTTTGPPATGHIRSGPRARGVCRASHR